MTAARSSETHLCGWPGCPAAVEVGLWGCSPHWYALPLNIRNAIYRTYRALRSARSSAALAAYRGACDAAEHFGRARDRERGTVQHRPGCYARETPPKPCDCDAREGQS